MRGHLYVFVCVCNYQIKRFNREIVYLTAGSMGKAAGASTATLHGVGQDPKHETTADMTSQNELHYGSSQDVFSENEFDDTYEHDKISRR